MRQACIHSFHTQRQRLSVAKTLIGRSITRNYQKKIWTQDQAPEVLLLQAVIQAQKKKTKCPHTKTSLVCFARFFCASGVKGMLCYHHALWGGGGNPHFLSQEFEALGRHHAAASPDSIEWGWILTRIFFGCCTSVPFTTISVLEQLILFLIIYDPYPYAPYVSDGWPCSSRIGWRPNNRIWELLQDPVCLLMFSQGWGNDPVTSDSL